jgi:hypothetical protein
MFQRRLDGLQSRMPNHFYIVVRARNGQDLFPRQAKGARRIEGFPRRNPTPEDSSGRKTADGDDPRDDCSGAPGANREAGEDSAEAER